MYLNYYPYTLELKNQFTISHSTRTTTPVVITEITHEGITGYGEASLPPYLTENQQSVINFLRKVNLEYFSDPLQLPEILEYVDGLESDNNAAKASVDIALHDLVGKLLNIPLYKYFKIEHQESKYSSITIGIDSIDNMIRKVKEAEDYKILKLKLGSDNDRSVIERIRTVTDKEIIVDVNQGWNDKYKALEFIKWLADKNVKLVEQPFPTKDIASTLWLSERSPLPIFADESVKRLSDIEKVTGIFHGINIKLMKSGGLGEALKMINKANELGLKIMLGCMTETSCAISAASHLSPLAAWVDLDGAELIKNDLFTGMKIVRGEVILPELPGTGTVKISG
jgi:L-alanine-DL-glutamate epimerase-like enolase superfamily enzyme